MCKEFNQCFYDVNICLWTDGSKMNRYLADAACQQRNSSYLPRITNIYLQSKLIDFRFAAWEFLREESFWIDVRAAGINYFHWIDGSSLTGFVASLYAHLDV